MRWLSVLASRRESQTKTRAIHRRPPHPRTNRWPTTSSSQAHARRHATNLPDETPTTTTPVGITNRTRTHPCTTLSQIRRHPRMPRRNTDQLCRRLRRRTQTRPTWRVRSPRRTMERQMANSEIPGPSSSAPRNACVDRNTQGTERPSTRHPNNATARQLRPTAYAPQRLDRENGQRTRTKRNDLSRSQAAKLDGLPEEPVPRTKPQPITSPSPRGDRGMVVELAHLNRKSRTPRGVTAYSR